MKTLKRLGVLHAVVDTNILIRAILKPTGSDGEVYKIFLSGAIILYFSEVQLRELNRVLRYPRIKSKYQVTDDQINTFISTFFICGKLISTTEKITICRDPDDNELLSLAASIASNNEVYLISGDKDVLILKGKVGKVMIMTPQEFLKSKINS